MAAANSLGKDLLIRNYIELAYVYFVAKSVLFQALSMIFLAYLDIFFSEIYREWNKPIGFMSVPKFIYDDWSENYCQFCNITMKQPQIQAGYATPLSSNFDLKVFYTVRVSSANKNFKQTMKWISEKTKKWCSYSQNVLQKSSLATKLYRKHIKVQVQEMY